MRMLLRFPYDKITDKVSCIIRTNHRPFFATYTSLIAFLAVHYYFLLIRLIVLIGITISRCTSKKPISCRLHKIITPFHSILIYNCVGGVIKFAFKKVCSLQGFSIIKRNPFCCTTDTILTAILKKYSLFSERSKILSVFSLMLSFL